MLTEMGVELLSHPYHCCHLISSAVIQSTPFQYDLDAPLSTSSSWLGWLNRRIGLLLDVCEKGVYVPANEVLLYKEPIMTVPSLQHVENTPRYAGMQLYEHWE